jgi:L-threonylcarbamoyladenylate synthase
VPPVRIALDALAAADVAPLQSRIRAAALVCFPTDTVYGVGGTLTPAVAAALVRAKGRDPGKPLQVVFASLALLESALEMAPALRAACRRLLPGPVTLLVPYPAGWRFPPPGSVGAEPGASAAPGEAAGGALAVGAAGAAPPPAATLGVRVPDWPPAARCLAALELPLVASSANPSGAPPPATLDAVDPALLAACDLALDGGRVGGVASSVVDLSRYAETGRWRLLRAGVWGRAEVAARLSDSEDGSATGKGSPA